MRVSVQTPSCLRIFPLAAAAALLGCATRSPDPPAGTTASPLQTSSPSNLAGAVDVMNNGAKGDCATDDSGAINAVIVALEGSSTHTGSVYFPAPPGGCYLVASPLVLHGVVDEVNPNIAMVGDGRGVSVVKAEAGAGIDAVLVKDAQAGWGGTISEMTFDAHSSATHAIHVENGSNMRLTRIEGLNGTTDDLHIDAGQGNYVTDSYFGNLEAALPGHSNPDYNVYVGQGSNDNFVLDTVAVNATVADFYEAGPAGGLNHFTSNHAYGWPEDLCPRYSFVTTYASVWIGNQSDCSSSSAFLVGGWNAQIVDNLLQGVSNHGVCISPTVGADIVTSNTIIGATLEDGGTFAVTPGNAIVQGATGEDPLVSCGGPGVSTATWGTDANYGASNVVFNNSPASDENVWNMLYVSNPSASAGSPTARIGVGTAAPQATLDVNGFLRLALNRNAPATCNGKTLGTIALNSSSQICECDGSEWRFDSNGEKCW